MHLPSVLLAAFGIASAAPQGQSHALYVDGMSPGSVANDRHAASPAGLPGFDHLMRNKSMSINNEYKGDFFDGQCLQVTLGGHGRVGQTVLEGRCIDDAGRWWQTSLSLNECIGNDAGKLVYRDGGKFDGSCRPCTLDNVNHVDLVLKCSCHDETKMPKYTSLGMGPNVLNSLSVKPVDGRFICGSHQGSKSPTVYKSSNP